MRNAIATKSKGTQDVYVPDGWVIIPFGEAVDFNPKRKLDKGMPAKFVAMTDIEPFTKSIGDFAVRSFSGGSKFKNGDTLMARITPCLENGKTAFVDFLDDGEVAGGSTEFIVLSGREKVSDSGFAYYLSTSPSIREIAIKAMTGTSGRQRVEVDKLASHTVLLPPLSEQKQIAEILSSLDDKVELNRAINTNLEKLASAIFKKWFVDVGDELPEGWKKVSLLDFADLLSGGTPKTEISEYWDGNIPWVSAKDVTMAQNSFILTTERQITQAGIDNSATHILPALTTVITARGTVGNYCLLGRDMAMNQTNYGLRAKDNKSHYFVFFSIAHLVEELRQRAYGTIFDTVTTHTFQHTEIVQPSDSQIELFEAIAGSIMAKVLANLRESETLKVVRDSLLPRLMSGKIRVN